MRNVGLKIVGLGWSRMMGLEMFGWSENVWFGNVGLVRIVGLVEMLSWKCWVGQKCHQKLSMARFGTNLLLFLVFGSGFQALKLAFELEHVSQLGKAGS